MDFTNSNAFVKSSQNSEISVPKMATDNLAWPMTMSALAYVTRAMPKGGGRGACECPRVGVFFNFSEGG